MITQEQTKRMAMDMSDIKIRETLVLSEQVKLRESRMKKVGVMRKIKMYDNGDPLYMHGIATDAKAKELEQEAENEVQKHIDRLQTINNSIIRLTTQTKILPILQKRMISEDLLKKYAFIVFTASLLPLRKYAAQNGLNRPWDGPNGAFFIDWEKRYFRGKQNNSVNNSSMNVLDNKIGITSNISNNNNNSSSNNFNSNDSSLDDLNDDDDQSISSTMKLMNKNQIKTVDQSLELSREATEHTLDDMRQQSFSKKITKKNAITDFNSEKSPIIEDDDDGKIN